MRSYRLVAFLLAVAIAAAGALIPHRAPGHAWAVPQGMLFVAIVFAGIFTPYLDRVESTSGGRGAASGWDAASVLGGLLWRGALFAGSVALAAALYGGGEAPGLTATFEILVAWSLWWWVREARRRVVSGR